MAATISIPIAKMDSLIALLADYPSDECRIAEEHLQAARIYLLGAMDEEYAVTLDMARTALAAIPDEKVRTQAESILP